MSMTEEQIVEKKAPKKAKRKVKRAAPKAVASPKVAGIFTGMSVTACCNGCNVDACVISGKSYCAHPRKGGLHAPEMSDHAALQRRKDAETHLRDQLLLVR